MRHHSLPLLLSLLPLALITTVATPATAQTAAAPALLNFQGRLTTPSGNPVPNGNYSIRFRLHNAAAAGTVLWEQTVAATAVSNGTFAALLNVGSGFQNGATAATLFNGNVWLSVKVGADAKLAPRSQITSVAYALKAKNAELEAKLNALAEAVAQLKAQPK